MKFHTWFPSNGVPLHSDQHYLRLSRMMRLTSWWPLMRMVRALIKPTFGWSSIGNHQSTSKCTLTVSCLVGKASDQSHATSPAPTGVASDWSLFSSDRRENSHALAATIRWSDPTTQREVRGPFRDLLCMGIMGTE